jgi:hypothetical protein
MLAMMVPAYAILPADDDTAKELRIDGANDTTSGEVYTMTIEMDEDVTGVRAVQFDITSSPLLCKSGTVNVEFIGNWQTTGFNENPIGNPGVVRVLGLKAGAVDGPLELVRMTCEVDDLTNGTVVTIGFENIVVGDSTFNKISDVSGEEKTVNIRLTKGDINLDGNVDALDVGLLADHLSGAIVLTPEEQTRADIFPSKADTGGETCGDGVLDVNDLIGLIGIAGGGTTIEEQCA